MSYTLTNKVRIVTAASLFDGHDAAINIMRRIMQSKGAEIIHLGHNRSVKEIVETAIEEDVQGIAITSYQGGHVEYFKYMKDLLEENGCGHIKIFGGGGGTILPDEMEELHAYGITRIYSPDDGRHMGLEGMIEDVIKQSASQNLSAGGALEPDWNGKLPLDEVKDVRRIARAISIAENGGDYSSQLKEILKQSETRNPPAGGRGAPVLGITGTGGAGKSSVTDEIVRRFLNNFTNKTIAVISVDPSKKKTGGALLGDRIRMNAISHPRAYMRSLATREDNTALSGAVQDAINICKSAGFDFIILESAGVGQSDASILDYCDVSLYVMTPEYGAASQLEKINMLDYADLICINKFDKAGALDAMADVKKQYRRNHQLFTAKEEDLPIVGTMASKFNDDGVNHLFDLLLKKIEAKTKIVYGGYRFAESAKVSQAIIPANRIRYLSEISENNRGYDQLVKDQAAIATKLYQLHGALKTLQNSNPIANGSKISSSVKDLEGILQQQIDFYNEQLTPVARKLITNWPKKIAEYQKDFYEYTVREKVIKLPMTSKSLSGTKIPKVVLPKYKDWGDILQWQAQENVPGHFPFTAGVFPLKREGEDPTRMFAGEGGPERTNRRFHYVSLDQPAIRLSTAFDSVTLYGEDPDPRPDIYGKVGNSGVSIATVDDAKKLYSGFDLCDPKTSVSMTINGPAPMLLAFFLNAAIDQQCEKYIIQNNLRDEVNKIIESKYNIDELPRYIGVNGKPIHPKDLSNLLGSEVSPLPGDVEGAGSLPSGNNGLGLRLLGLSGSDVLPKEVYEKIKAEALTQVRGTVQADILKEDQAQNTCIFSTEFALKLMGDVQEYFIQHKIRNFYSVSISGYHIAEAGANPISQLAFTLSNGFTYVEYYQSRGMSVDDFAPNLSFFFSNGMDPEYSVIGRVARKIWAKAMKYKYKANKRSQMLKYHIQTSGRSLHAQEIDFNDIRTTLQALYAIYDNCNSLHTNAYDEAITTPTEESVRRAMAIQLIINRELGTAKNENPNQGSFLIEELTDLVEEAVLAEFDRITERGGVLGAMERMYQRNKIQEESLVYEHQKHSGELPLIGVNTFLNKKGSPTILPTEVIRSTTGEKEQQVQTLQAFWKRNENRSEEMLQRLKAVAINNGNLFAELMETVKCCSLGQITHALYEVGGQYRRNM
ncbi:MAG: methylmalonyl-CoA mutase family protein [Chitinophagaceae bacterium]|nr:methylmalonyl-CoA mutase family protein [Chitinophagaceae bacterium]